MARIATVEILAAAAAIFAALLVPPPAEDIQARWRGKPVFIQSGPAH